MLNFQQISLLLHQKIRKFCLKRENHNLKLPNCSVIELYFSKDFFLHYTDLYIKYAKLFFRYDVRILAHRNCA